MLCLDVKPPEKEFWSNVLYFVSVVVVLFWTTTHYTLDWWIQVSELKVETKNLAQVQA